MAIKLACSDFTFPLLTHQQALDLIGTLGFKGVDIGLFQDRSHLQPASEFAQLRRNARKLKRQLDDRGLQMADLFLQGGLVAEPINSPHRRSDAKPATGS
jgi:sugar phosphate isomerase/epimerase